MGTIPRTMNHCVEVGPANAADQRKMSNMRQPEGYGQSDPSPDSFSQPLLRGYSPNLPNSDTCYGLGVSTCLTFVIQSALLVNTSSETSVTNFP